MNHELQKITYYDLLAALCNKIDTATTEEKKRIYQDYVQRHRDYESTAEEILQIYKIADNRDVINTDLDKDLACGFMNIMDQSEDGNLLAMAGISLIDKYLGTNGLPRTYLKDCPITDCSGAVIGVSPHFKLFDALNPNSAAAWGTILPLVKCSWGKKSPRNMGTVSENPLSILRHHLWIPNCHGYNLHHLFYTGSLAGKETLNVLASPITCIAPFRLLTSKDTTKYKIEYDKDSQKQIAGFFERLISHTIDANVDIAIFPEMLGFEDGMRITTNLYHESWDGEKPKITLLPTMEYCVDADSMVFINELAVLDEDGGALFRYHKQHPFEYDKKTGAGHDNIYERYFEPITPDRELFIIHIPRVGRVGIMVCSDIFDPDLRDFLINQNKLTLLLHPSFSGGWDLLERAYSTAIEHSCDIVLCNTCAAFLSSEEIEKPLASRELKAQVTTNVCKYFAYGHKGNKPISISSKCDTSQCRGCYTLFKIPFDYNITCCPERFI